MSDLTTYPLQDWFETTLAQSWNGWTGTVYLNTAPSFTFPSGVKTYIVVNPWKTNMQVGRIDSINVWNKTVNVDSVTIEKGAGVNYSAQIHAVGSKVIISDNYQFWKDIATAINSKADIASPVFTGSVTVPEYADNTARDTAIPSPTNWMIVQTGGIYQWYNAGTAQWEDFDIGTPPPDASTTVKGLVQEATTAQVWASTATWSTGAKLFINPASVVKTSSGAADENKLVALNAQGQVAAGFINNASILAEWVEALVDKDTYFLWEDADVGDSVFVEDMVTFASATSVQNIGDVSGNTRVSIPAFGSGTASNTLKLALRKFVSPSVDLGVRIETDNAGEPSWTLADANATATVLTSWLTTSLVDTTVTLAWSVTLTEWTKYHIVLFAGTYGAETINGTNYFGVGYSTNNTSTRSTRYYNGSIWNVWTWTLLADTRPTWPYTNQWGITESNWYRMRALNDLYIISVTKPSDVTATRARIISDTWSTTLATATFVWDVATFSTPYYFTTNTYFRIEYDNSWWTYTRYRITASSFTWVDRTNVRYDTWSTNWSTDLIWYNVLEVNSITINATWFTYTTSSLFNSKLLSKTNATYSYKLPTDVPRIATESKSAGENCITTTLGFNDNFSGLTPNVDMYLADTPWAISSTPWVYNYYIGSAIDATTLNVGKKQMGVFTTILTSTSNSADTGTIQAPTDWFVTVKLSASNGGSAIATNTLTYWPSSASNTVGEIGVADASIEKATMTFPVKKWYYWRALTAGTNSTTTTNVFFTPYV